MSSGDSEVKSKFFVSEGMDSSSCDFQEKKPYIVKSKKPFHSKLKKKKQINSKGQQDIRKTLMKNELLFTREFYKECQNAGLGAEAEQLQLAIALSKSVIPENETNTVKVQQTLSSNSKNIQKTLQELGFKLGNQDINKANKTKKKRKTKDSKLLRTTIDQKNQIISDKYSQVLLEQPINWINHEKISLSNVLDHNKIYYLTTCATYENIKDDDIFYVIKPLRSLNKAGCLLKDWNEIPGRPCSPILNKNTLNDKILLSLCSLKLDNLLSGSFNIINTMFSSDAFVLHVNDVNKAKMCSSQDLETSIDMNARVASPDIFDDDLSIVLSDNVQPLSKEFVDLTQLKDSCCTMDFTNCVKQSSQKNISSTYHADSNTKYSDDIMEFTECVATKSQCFKNIFDSTNKQKLIETNREEIIVDLTQNEKDDSYFNKSEVISNNLHKTFTQKEDISFLPKDSNSDSYDKNKDDSCDKYSNVTLDFYQDYMYDHETDRHEEIFVNSENKIDNHENEIKKSFDNEKKSVGYTNNNEISQATSKLYKEDNTGIINLADELGVDNENVSSQNSEIFVLSDCELEYSVNKSVFEIQHLNTDTTAYNIGCENIEHNEISVDDSLLPAISIKGKAKSKCTASKKTSSSEPSTPNKSEADKINVETPKSNYYIIKTDQVTPLLDYKSLSTPDIHKELNKFGVKPFKRKRAIKILTHIYNQTHPYVKSYTSSDSENIPKKIKLSNNKELLETESIKPTDNTTIGEEKLNIYEVTDQITELKEIELDDDLFFPKREKAKVHSCRLPLHIVFHNYISCRKSLREAILRYEPVKIDVIHKQLSASGHKFDPKDLLKFMDKKCITVKTNDNCARNRKLNTS